MYEELIKKTTYVDDLSCLENPQWDKKTRVHDWRNYVPDEVIEAWAQLSLDFRAGIFLLAQKTASNEEWD